MMETILNLSNYKAIISEYFNKFDLKNIDRENFLLKIENGITNSMSNEELAKFSGEMAAALSTIHLEYSKLSSIIITSYLSSITSSSFSQKIKYIKENSEILDDGIYQLIQNNAAAFDSIIDYQRDYDLSYFSISTFMRSYLIKIDNVIIERPQDVFLRTAIQIHRDNLHLVKQTYDLISLRYFTHATPTLYNSCLKNCQLGSCFLITVKDDNIEGIYDTIKDAAMITKYSGGMGISLHNVRSRGSLLKSSGGFSKGIVPIIRIINETMKYINVGGIKRTSTTAFYLEPWHKDIFDFIDIKKNTGDEEMRARDVFIALWICDLFMERVERNEDWSLFDPNEAKGLSDVWGNDFNKLYLKYEKTKSRTVVPAQKLFRAIINSQIETGVPYMLYKDTANKFSNQQNLGTIKSSNLCAEIIEYSSPEEIAVCNLLSICLPQFVHDGSFNFETLRNVVKAGVVNLNKCIDGGFYPVKETKTSNFLHRPIGIGIQGLADTFAKLRYPFESDEAKKLNKLISETMYFAAIESSLELAMVDGPYSSFVGSPLSKGIFHFEMYGASPSGMWDWESLRAKVIRHGVRNSLFIALMPTAGTSQLLGNSECFEPITSNLFTRRTLAGEFQVVNNYLMEDLIKLGLWNEEMKNIIVEHEGSIQNIPIIPDHIKNLYKTVWEIKMKTVIDLAADRQLFVDQSQSLNIYLQEPSFAQLSSMHFYGWKKGLKTGMYYLRTKPISKATKFTVNQEQVQKSMNSMLTSNSDEDKDNVEEAAEQPGYCESCSC
jgi:ribonucleoside-diphosphate reductase subunit M1